MDAVTFVEEHKRICESHKNCNDCPLVEFDDCERGDPEELVKAVEAWSEKHPNREKAEKAVAEYLRKQDIANSEYLIVAKEILEGRQHGEADAISLADEQLD